eukprot:5250616-Prymnesium_polylepis.1
MLLPCARNSFSSSCTTTFRSAGRLRALHGCYESTTDLAVLMAIFCFAFLFVVLFVLSRTTRSIDELVKQRLIAIEEFKKVQAAFDELAPTASVAGLPSTISAGGDRTTIDSVQRLQNQSSETEQKELRPGNAIRTRLAVLQGSIVDDKARSARLASAAARIRDQEYSIRQFFEDMVYAFPELDLYLPIEVSEA